MSSGGAFDFSNEWSSLIFLLLPLGVAAVFLRGFLQHRRQHPRYDLSIVAALRAMIDENRLARLRLRVSMGVLTVAMALMPVMTHQLQLVGKQRPHEAASMLAVFASRVRRRHGRHDLEVPPAAAARKCASGGTVQELRAALNIAATHRKESAMPRTHSRSRDRQWLRC